MAKSPSKEIYQAKSLGQFQGLRTLRNIVVSHLLFANDILLFGPRNVSEGKVINEILHIFSSATRNKFEKLPLYSFGLNGNLLDWL